MKPRSFLVSAAVLVGAALAARAQDPPAAAPPVLPPGVVARVYGEDVTEAQLFDRLARRYETQDKGKEILEQIVDDEIVAIEAQKRGVTVTDAEAKAYADRAMEYVVRMRGGGKMSLDDVLAETKSTREDFYRTAREYLAREKMARADLGTKPEEELPEHRMKLWVSSIRRAMNVRYEGLPDGVLAQIGESVRIDRRRFAKELATRLPPEVVSGVRAELIVDAATRHAVRESGVAITEDDVAAQVARLRKRFEENPRIQGTGITFDQFLKQTFGMGEADLPKDPTFRSRVGLERLLGRDVTDESVRTYWEANRASYGDRALVRFVFVPAADDKDKGQAKLPTFREASDLALRAKVEILTRAGLLKGGEQKAGSLADVVGAVAKQFESDQEKRAQAGEPVAWTRGGLAGEPKLEEAAFTGEIGQVQGPIRTGVGYYVLYVEERRPAPTYDEVKARVREDLLRIAIRDFQMRLRADGNIVIAK